ncbi:MAG: hypothetical protein KJ621_08220 [Proteobacteria bacterium]|nr:hypothetical protein [Pseudomonadota bacterium]MBU1741602.1 hypothetical protein [Pseudomonadota bacterium]
MSSIKKTALILFVAGGLLVGGFALTPDQAQALAVPSAAQIVTSAQGAPWWGHHGPGHGRWRHRPHRPWYRPGYRPAHGWGRPYRRHRCVWRPGFRDFWGRWHRGRRVCW